MVPICAIIHLSTPPERSWRSKFLQFWVRNRSKIIFGMISRWNAKMVPICAIIHLSITPERSSRRNFFKYWVRKGKGCPERGGWGWRWWWNHHCSLRSVSAWPKNYQKMKMKKKIVARNRFRINYKVFLSKWRGFLKNGLKWAKLIKKAHWCYVC